MNVCEKCGGELFTERVGEYRDDEFLGVPNLTLIDAVEEERCRACGAVTSITIPKIEQMTAAAAVARAKMPAKLSGDEIRFLRKALDWSAQKLAEALDIKPETLSRWENEKQQLGAANEKLLRGLVVSNLRELAPGVEVEPDEILTMKIEPFVRKDSPRLVYLSYGPVTVNRRRVKAWEEADRAA